MTDTAPFLSGITPERIGQPFDFLDHAPVAVANRMAALHHLDRAREALALLSDALRAMPDDDDTIDAAIRVFAAESDRAGGHLQTFRSLRECVGSG